MGIDEKVCEATKSAAPESGKNATSLSYDISISPGYSEHDVAPGTTAADCRLIEYCSARQAQPNLTDSSY